MEGRTGRLGRRFSLTSLAAVVVALLAAPPVASAQGILDANCPGPETIAFPSGDDARWAQTFTALRSGSLVRAETEIGKPGPAGDFAMQILATDAAGGPTNTVLASTTIGDASVPTGNSRISGVFAAPASVVAGQQYAFVITRPGEEFIVRDRGDNPCPGAEYLSISQTAPFGGADTCCDLIFAVFVEPPGSGVTCKGRRATQVGSSGNDDLVGTASRDVIAALSGKDKVSGLAGKDLICGGKGKDTLKGGKGKDKLLGQGGRDSLRGGGGKDVCTGGKKDDSAKGCEVEKSI